MSGEYFIEKFGRFIDTDLRMLAEDMEDDDPFMSQLIMELAQVLYRYNYWQSGDCSEESYRQSVRTFCGRFCEVPVDDVTARAMAEKVVGMIRSMTGE